ncbi:hypothetical protein [Escherichia marmotae]|uniref:hypothetical protein n=1 Tax=Escherichia marmotae TaxID=1499973 RepID=UPI003CF8DBB0
MYSPIFGREKEQQRLLQAIQAATAAVQGLTGGNLSAALAGGAAPYLAEVVKIMTTDPVTGEMNKAANVAVHAVVNAALAVAQGNNALAGAAGAVVSIPHNRAIHI